MTRFAWVCALIALALAVPSAGTALAAEPYDFQVIVPLTGAAAFLGTAEQKGIATTEAVINQRGGLWGRPVHFVFHDDQSSPQTALQLLTQVEATHPVVVFGSTLTAICNAMAPLVQNGPVLYCFSAGIHPPAGSFVFSSQIAAADQVKVLLRYFRSRHWNRIAVITTTDASGQDGGKAITEYAASPENKDLRVVDREYFEPTATSVAALVQRIAAAQPQVIVSWATATAAATFFRALQQAGVDVPVASTGSIMTYPQLNQYADFLPKELYFGVSQWVVNGSPKVPLPRAVANQQREYFAASKAAGYVPDGPTDVTWDSPNLIVAALNRIGPNATAEQLRDYLLHLRGYPGVDGLYDFQKVPQRGIDADTAVVVRWNAATKGLDSVGGLGGAALSP